jgi:hypothetical protein
VEAVAKADGSAGWCLSVCATAAFVVSKAASAEVKQEVFGDILHNFQKGYFREKTKVLA